MNIYMIGDSTMKFNNYYTYPQTGWGQVLNLFCKEDILVFDYAENGRSTKSFIDEGRFKKVLDKMEKGDLATKLKWKCGYCKNEFEASPCLILLGGFWCPKCYIPQEKWDYDNIARTCPFFGQLWYNDHPKDENNVYIFKEIYKKK